MIKEVLKAPADRNYDDDVFIDTRPLFIRLLSVFNNFGFGPAIATLFIGFLFWVLPFLDMARIISDSIALNCGAK